MATLTDAEITVLKKLAAQGPLGAPLIATLRRLGTGERDAAAGVHGAQGGTWKDLYTDSNGYVQEIALGASGYVLTSNGTGAAPSYQAMAAVTVLDRDVSLSYVQNNAGETTMYSYAMPGNTISTNKMVRVTMLGSYQNNSGAARDFTVRVSFGATNVFIGTFSTVGAHVDTRALRLICWINATGATNTQVAGSTCELGGVSTAGSPPTSGLVFGSIVELSDSLSKDTTSAQTIAITFQHSASDANLIARCFTVETELV